MIHRHLGCSERDLDPAPDEVVKVNYVVGVCDPLFLFLFLSVFVSVCSPLKSLVFLSFRWAWLRPFLDDDDDDGVWFSSQRDECFCVIDIATAIALCYVGNRYYCFAFSWSLYSNT